MEFNMSDNYHEGTGELVLEEVTPIIKALFGSFEVIWNGLDEDANTASISFSTHSHYPNWGSIHERLKNLASSMKLSLPDGSDGSLLEYLYLFIAHFKQDDDPFFENIDNCDFDDTPSLEILFNLAIRFDDGHGLKYIEFEESWYGSKLRHGDFGGGGTFISRDVTFNMNSHEAAHFAQPLSTALSSGNLEQATTHLLSEVNWLLGTIRDTDIRQKVRQGLISKLNASRSGLR